MSSPFNAKINYLIDIVNSTWKEAEEDIQFCELLFDFIKSEKDYKKKLRDEANEILEFASIRISSDFRKKLFSEIENKSGKIDEINATELIKNVDRLSKQEFIDSWQYSLKLIKQSEDELSSKKRLEKALEEVLEFAKNIIDYDFQYHLSLETQDKSGRIDEINATELIKNIDKLRKQEFIDSWQSFLNLIKQSEDKLSRKKIEKELGKVLELAKDVIGQDFQYRLSSKTQDKSEKIDEISVVELIKNVDEFRRQKFINLWQSFLRSKKECENDLKERFKKIHRATRTVNCNLRNKFQEICFRLKEKYDAVDTFESLVRDKCLLIIEENKRLLLETKKLMPLGIKIKDVRYIWKAKHGVQYGEYTCIDGAVIKGKNIPTNRLKNENNQLQGANGEHFFIGDKMVGL